MSQMFSFEEGSQAIRNLLDSPRAREDREAREHLHKAIMAEQAKFMAMSRKEQREYIALNKAANKAAIKRFSK